MADDPSHMRAALALARRGLGNTWPNPSVGCVIVRDGRVVGRGNTAPWGRPHAEPQALAMAGELARGAADPARAAALEELGVALLRVPGGEAGVDIAAGLAALAGRGITRLLVEGGARLAATLLRADLVDRLAWFHAPAVMGGDGVAAAQAFGVTALAAMPRFRRLRVTMAGDDVLTELQRLPREDEG